jgi:two-component SAPR family response regulator
MVQSETRRAQALGHPRVHVGSRKIARSDWGSRRATEFFFLLLQHPQGLTKEQIVETLFPESDGPSGDGLFHSTLYRCRQALGKEVIVRDDDIYRVANFELWDYDVSEFEALVRRCREAADASAVREAYEAAVRLYRGEYLEGWFCEWCEPTRLRLRQQYAQAGLTMASRYAREGWPEAALELYRRAVEQDYYLEAAHRGIVDTLLVLGDRLAAMRHYLDLTERLKREVPPAERSEIPDLVDEIMGRSLSALLGERSVSAAGVGDQPAVSSARAAAIDFSLDDA